MIIKHDSEIITLVEKLKREMNDKSFNQYWKGLHTLPFALYNDQNIYLANHCNPPDDFKKSGNIFSGKWRKEFLANTSIAFAGEMMGIYNLKYLPPFLPFEKIYSYIVHEIFHAFQTVKSFRVDYNEIMLIKYPFTIENIGLRMSERKELLNAVFAEDKDIKKGFIKKYISFREKRREIIGDFLNYELGVESIEGTASYVEYKAYSHKSELPQKFIISQFGKNLSGYPDDLKHLRLSCYSSGMFMCLLLDQNNIDWQEEYFESGLYLYDYFLDKIGLPRQDIHLTDFSYAEYLITEEEENKREKLKKFYNMCGHKLILCGDMLLAGLDPMNVRSIDEHVLHESFLIIKATDTELFFTGPVLARHNEDLKKIEEIIFFSNYLPQIDKEVVQIKDIGKIRAKVHMEKEVYYIKF